MDFEPNADQVAILDGLEQLIASIDVEAPKEGVFAAFSPALDQELRSGGFLHISQEEGCSLLDAALVVERVARLPVSVEAAASALVAPLLQEAGVGPLALGVSPAAAARFLPQARALLVDAGEDVLLIEVNPDEVEAVDTLFAYPYGRLRRPDGVVTKSLGKAFAAPLRRRWRLVLAVEAAGLMQAALDEVLEHVKTRQQFGRPLGSFQAVQHRLAMAASTAQAARWLALRAAWSDDETDCAVAATYVQDATPRLTYDLHQFCGAMGLTLEFRLHHWTYRLKALMGELGGSSRQARTAAERAWTNAA
ncbi:MAG: acyl-CoA dehydrogenase [Sphingomonadales bacterium]|nr:acyl-CoA dehydrogenase [Sphingomonadales bacterium]